MADNIQKNSVYFDLSDILIFKTELFTRVVINQDIAIISLCDQFLTRASEHQSTASTTSNTLVYSAETTLVINAVITTNL